MVASRTGSPFGSKVDLASPRSEDGVSLHHFRALSRSQTRSDSGHASGQGGGVGESPIPHSGLVSSPLSIPISTGKKPRNVLRRRPSATRDKGKSSSSPLSNHNGTARSHIPSSMPSSPTSAPGMMRGLATRMTTSTTDKTATTTTIQKITRSASFSTLSMSTGKKTKKTNVPTPPSPPAAPVSQRRRPAPPSVGRSEASASKPSTSVSLSSPRFPHIDVLLPATNDRLTPASALAEAYRRRQAYQHNELEAPPNTPDGPHAPYYTIVGTTTPRVSADEYRHTHMSWAPDLGVTVLEKVGFAKSLTRKVSGRWKRGGGEVEIEKKRSRSRSVTRDGRGGREREADRDRDKAGGERRVEGRGRRERSATVGAGTSGRHLESPGRRGFQATLPPPAPSSRRLAAGDADEVRPSESSPEAGTRAGVGTSRRKKQKLLRLSLSIDGIPFSDLGSLGLGLDSPLRFGKNSGFEHELEREKVRGRMSDLERWTRASTPPIPPPNSAAHGVVYGSKDLPPSVTTPTKTPTVSPVSGSGAGSRIWKLVKRISVGGLRERYHHDPESAPPVPALPKDVRLKTSGVGRRMGEGVKEPETKTEPKTNTGPPARANSVQGATAACPGERARKALVKKSSQSFSVSRSQTQTQTTVPVPVPVPGVAARGGGDPHDTLVRQVTAGTTTDSSSPPRLFPSSGHSSASSLSLVGDRDREGPKEDKSELETPPVLRIGGWIVPPSELGKLFVEKGVSGAEDGGGGSERREVDKREDWMMARTPSLPLPSLPFPPRRNHMCGGEGSGVEDDGGVLLLDSNCQDGDVDEDGRPASPEIPVFSAVDPINAFSSKRASVSPLKASHGSSPWKTGGEEGDERETGGLNTTVGLPESKREPPPPLSSSPVLESEAGGPGKDENDNTRHHIQINPARLPASMRRDFGLGSASPGPTLTRGALHPNLFQSPMTTAAGSAFAAPVANNKRRSTGDYSMLSMASTVSTTVTARPSLGDLGYSRHHQQQSLGTVGGRRPSGTSLFSSSPTTEVVVSEVRLRRDRRRKYGTFGEQFGDEDEVAVVRNRKSGEEEEQDGSLRRKPLTEREKAKRWDDLLERSARAGGTLHLDVNGGEDGLKSDQINFSEVIGIW